MVCAEDWLTDLYTRQAEPLQHYMQALQKCRMKEEPIDLSDCIHDVFMLAWQKRETLYAHPNIDGWLRQSAKYILLKKQAQAQVHAAHIAFHLDNILETGMESLRGIVSGIPPQSQDELDIQNQMEQIREIVGDKTLAFLIAYYSREISTKNMAQKYRISENAIRVRIKRALDRIRANLRI